MIEIIMHSEYFVLNKFDKIIRIEANNSTKQFSPSGITFLREVNYRSTWIFIHLTEHNKGTITV